MGHRLSPAAGMCEMPHLSYRNLCRSIRWLTVRVRHLLGTSSIFFNLSNTQASRDSTTGSLEAIKGVY